jgi:tetratricopeptide (TPR) repeat protein
VKPGPHVVVLRGIGGQGKSQVAMEYCRRRKDGPSPDIFWIDATSENSVTSTFISISDLIRTTTDQLPDNNARLAFVRRKFANWPTELLLVFDNYDDPHEFPNIQDYFPPNKLSSILVTGRHADIGTLVLGQDDNLIELSGLADTAAVDLLEHHSQARETNGNFGEEIVERLGYHPLAITQAGTYIRKGGIPLGEFLDIYKQEKAEILTNTPQLSQYRRKLGDAENEISLNVFTTWQLSFQQLLSHVSEDSVAVKLLRLLAFFDNKDISEWIFIEFHRNSFSSKTFELLEWVNQFTDNQQRWSNRLFKKNLVLLHDFCLLQSVAEDADGYSHASLHPLVKDWIHLQMRKSTCQQYALMASQILADILAASYESQHFQLPLQTKQYLALHVIAQEGNNSEYLGISCAEVRQDLVIEYTSNQEWFADFFAALGLHNKAERLQVQLVETKKKMVGPEHPNTLKSINNLASTYRNQGRWEEAETLEVQVLEIIKRVLGPEHPNTLKSINNLASTYRNQGRWEEAETLGVQVLEMRKRVLGPEHPDTLISMGNLALKYWDQGRWEEAETLEVQVLETEKRVRGAENPGTLTSMNNLAFTWKKQGRYSNALQLMEECVQLRTRILGKNHPDTLSSSSTLLEWQAENLEISSLVEESPAVDNIAS